MSVNEKKKITNKRYDDKCDKIMIKPLKEKGKEIRAAAAASGMSLQGYCLKAIEQYMQHENSMTS